MSIFRLAARAPRLRGPVTSTLGASNNVHRAWPSEQTSVPLIAITRLRVRSWHFLPAFFFQTIRAAAQAKRAQGNVAASVLRDAHRTFWTRTVWADEQAMRSYMSADSHRRVMRSLAEWCAKRRSCIGFKLPRSHQPGRRHTVACNGTGGRRRSIIPPRLIAHTKSHRFGAEHSSVRCEEPYAIKASCLCATGQPQPAGV